MSSAIINTTTISSNSSNDGSSTSSSTEDFINASTTSTTPMISSVITAAPPIPESQADGSRWTASNTSVSNFISSLSPTQGSLLDAFNSSRPSFPGISIADLYLPDDEAGTRDPNFPLPVFSNITSTVSPSSFNVTSRCGNVTSFCSGSDITKTRVYTKEDLWAENDHFARTLIPAMVLIGLLMIIGTLGNSLVVYVYGFRFKSATQHFLICCLASFDLLMCLVAMPSEMADLRYHHTFSSLAACKLLRFITMFSSISSTFTLLTIARDRHRRVTRPLTKQMTPKRARMWQLVNVGGALFFAWPTLVMTGLRSSETRLDGLMGTDCSWSDSFSKTKFPLAYNTVLGSGFSVIVLLLSVLYFRIWKTAKTHRVNMNNKRKSAGGDASGISDEDGRGGFSRAGDEADTPIKRGKRVRDEESSSQGGRVMKDNCEWLGICETCAPVERDSGVYAATAVSKEKLSCQGNLAGTKIRLESTKNEIGDFDNSPRRFLKRREKSILSTTNHIESNSNENENERRGTVTPSKTSCSESNYPPTPSLSCSTSASPSLSKRSFSSSPALRTRACHSWSIRSDDLRPLSSLMEAVSKSLAQSRTFDSVELSSPDEQCSNYSGDKRGSKRIMRSQSLDSASRCEPRSEREDNSPASDIHNKKNMEKQFSEASGFQEFAIRVSQNATDSCRSSPENLIRVQQSNSTETCDKVTNLRHGENDLNQYDCSITLDPNDDDTDLACWSIPLSKFSHLKSSLSRPMYIPDVMAATSEDEDPMNTSDEKSCRMNVLQEKMRSMYVPNDEPGLDNSVDGDNSEDRSSNCYPDKRRSTVVSVLERYRIHMGSLASLDNITIDSKFSTKKSPLGLDKTTIVAFAVTSVFVLSFLPYLVLMFVRGFRKDFDYSLDNASLCLYNIFVRFYLINSAVNPILYGVLNSRFRVECVRIFRRIFFCVPRKMNSVA